MSALLTAIGETASTPGTGNLTLTGAVAGHRAFDAATSYIPHPATNYAFDYRIELQSDATVWETGRGLYTKSGVTKTVVRSKVRSSSVNNAAVNFTGAVYIYVTADGHSFGPQTGCRIYGLTAGSSTAYTAVMKPALQEVVDGMLVMLEIHTTSGASPTFSPDGLTARSIVDNSGAALAAGAMLANSTVLLRYRASGTQWWLVGGFTGGSVPNTITMGTAAKILLDDSVTSAGSNIPLAFDGDPDTGLVRTAANSMSIVAGGSTIAAVATTGIAVTGALSATGDLSTNAALFIDADADANFNLQKSGGAPLIVFDTGDNLTYDRTGNGFNFNIGSTLKFAIGSSTITTTAVTLNAGNIALQSGAALSHATGGNTVVDTSGHLCTRTYANVGALPSAASFNNAIVWLAASTTPGTACLVHSNGSAWVTANGVNVS